MKVWNKRDPKCPKDAFYVGRPSMLGNPFSHLDVAGTYRVESRDVAVDCYAIWIEQHPALTSSLINSARGRDLSCWCAPARCHADIILRIANS